ncbi:hypothetical protein VE02_05744 [Pseudogymnoascus sp. 03VT05]|nr:hypothetical protein VE02_05744 [Pseudogymnoascus sp. 03VT05]
MSPTLMNTSMHMASSLRTTPPSDFLDRHEYGVTKNRTKPASTGGGRAWSEEEEVYLLQTRLQRMPYKHIAAHLKKTELACRLHYHQLSHGSNRRKRTASMSSAASTACLSPPPPAIPSPIRERPISPPSYSTSPTPTTPLITLPRLLPPVAILPKPSPATTTLLTQHAPPPQAALRLNCAVDASALTPNDIDKERLRRIYDNHRAAFWYAIAAEYGAQAPPALLEEVWRRGGWCAPPTPCGSPEGEVRETSEKRRSSISDLLGIDASPRSPRERELIKRLEEEGRLEMV